MTTLKKLISEIDFNNEKLKSDPNWGDLSRCFNINELGWSDDIRLTCHYIKVHYCTDSWVGIKAYFLDNRFVAISEQLGRKHNEEFSFVSDEEAKNVRNYLLSLQEEIDRDNFDLLCDIDDEIPDTYKIEYNTQILHKSALLTGEKVKILKTNFESEGIESKNYFHSVEIEHENGKKEIVDCRDLDFQYNTIF
jgi:hypothetical protein